MSNLGAYIVRFGIGINFTLQNLEKFIVFVVITRNSYYHLSKYLPPAPPSGTDYRQPVLSHFSPSLLYICCLWFKLWALRPIWCTPMPLHICPSYVSSIHSYCLYFCVVHTPIVRWITYSCLFLFSSVNSASKIPSGVTKWYVIMPTSFLVFFPLPLWGI